MFKNLCLSCIETFKRLKISISRLSVSEKFVNKDNKLKKYANQNLQVNKLGEDISICQK